RPFRAPALGGRSRYGGNCDHLRHGWGRKNGLFTRPFLQLQAEAVLLHLENGEVVFFHQIDDGFDIFEFQRRVLSGVVETLGKAVLMAGSSRGLGAERAERAST